MTRNEQYKLAKSSKFKENVELNAHMAKNSEYGAVLYLAHSKYGVNKQKVAQNTDGNNTGGSNDVSIVYKTNQKQSTTFNANGVYDLNGGAVSNTASYVANGSNELKTNGGSQEGDLYGATTIERTTSTAYKTVYEGTGEYSPDFGKTEKRKGDALYETSKSSDSTTGAWFSGPSSFPRTGGPFFGRGGRSSDTINTSIFCLGYNAGIATNYYSFYTILTF